MMKNRIQRILSTIISICCILYLFNINLMALDNNSDQFTIILNCRETVDLAGVELSVYKKVNVKQYTDNLSSYDKEYVCSAVSDKNGIIHFDRPAGDYIVEFDLSTLPSGTGITKQTIDYTQNITNDTVTLYPISSIEAILTQGNINFKFKNGNNAVLTNYEILSHTIENVSNMESTTINTREYIGMNLTLSHTGQIDVNGTVYPYSVNEEFTELTQTEYLAVLNENGMISETEDMGLLCNVFENDIENTRSSGILVGDPNTLTYVIRTVSCSQGINCCEEGVHTIKVYYYSPCTSSIANTIADKVVNMFTYYVNQLGFLCPKSIDYIDEITGIDDSFCVVLSRVYGTAATCWGDTYDGLGGAYIVLPYDEPSRWDTYLAHEFQHCIQRQYDLIYDSDLWWKESCANWAAMLYADDVLNDLSSRLQREYKSGLKDYLATTNKSITKDDNDESSREYSPLFPMMLAQAYDGAETIVDIYEEIKVLRAGASSCSDQQIFDAIGNVVEDIGNYDLRYELEYFGRSNYQYASYYDWYQGTAWTNAQIDNIALTRSNICSLDIEHVGYGYFELTSSPDIVNINIDVTTITPTEFTCWIIEGFGDNGTAKTTKIRFTSSELNLTYNFTSSLGDNLVLIVENISTQNDAFVNVTIN